MSTRNFFDFAARLNDENEEENVNDNGSEESDHILEDDEIEEIHEDDRRESTQFVGKNGRLWVTEQGDQRGRRGRENVVRERSRVTVAVQTPDEAINAFFTEEMRSLIVTETNREARRAIAAEEVSQHIQDKW